MTNQPARLKTSPLAANKSARPKIIFFGNGPLADFSKAILEKSCDIIFHARKKSDLDTVKALKSAQKDAHGVLASFGVIIKKDLLNLFEPEGILNIHPSLLPKYRGPSPIETAILNGDTEFSVSVMKLSEAMDAGPVYFQTTLKMPKDAEKSAIYEALATAGATWLAKNLTKATATSLEQLVTPVSQKGEPTYTKMLDKSLSPLLPSQKTAHTLLNEIRAFSSFPKSKFTFFGLDCAVIKAHVLPENILKDTSLPLSQAINSAPNLAPGSIIKTASDLALKCKNESFLIIDQLQPAGRKIMDARSFLNGYAKND